MKLFFISLTFLFVTISSTAQIELEALDVTVDTTLDLSDIFVQTWTRLDLTNTSSTETLKLKWVIEEIDVPEPWSFFGTDGTAHGYFDSPSNIDSFGGYEFVVLPEEVSFIGIHVRVNETAGCGVYEMRLYSLDSVDVELAKITYNFKVNSPNCTVGTADLMASQMNISPNPASDVLNIEFLPTGFSDQEKIRLVNLEGKVLEEQILVAHKNTYTLDIHEYVNGIYFFQYLQDGQVVGVRKVVIQK